MVVMEHVYLQCITMSLWNITLLTSFLKPMHIFASNFGFSQTALQILMKYGSYIQLGKVSQVCLNEGCMTYFHRLIVIYSIIINM